MKSSRVMILAGVLSAAAGCSSTDDFVGSWKYTSGTSTITCSGEDPITDNLTGNITINEGSSSDLILVDAECSLKLSMDGDKASLDGSQTCVNSDGSLTVTFTAFTFKVDDTTAHLSSSGTASVNVGGSTVNCTISASGDLEKL
jgi:hypothetical protein